MILFLDYSKNLLVFTQLYDGWKHNDSKTFYKLKRFSWVFEEYTALVFTYKKPALVVDVSGDEGVVTSTMSPVSVRVTSLTAFKV